MFLVGKPERKIPLGKSTGRWEGNIKIDLRKDEVVCTGFIWLRPRLVEGSCEHGNKPSGSIKCWKILEWLRN
jgi:hypothetical protein